MAQRKRRARTSWRRATSSRARWMSGYVVSVRYIALLRGINVGGKTLIKMADLKTCIEALGFDAVSTYIASGNVLFESAERDAAKLEANIERAIEQRFRLPVKVVVLDRAAYAQIVKAIPKSWVGDASLRANVAFVRRGTDAKQVVRELQPDASVEEVKAPLPWGANVGNAIAHRGINKLSLVMRLPASHPRGAMGRPPRGQLLHG